MTNNLPRPINTTGKPIVFLPHLAPQEQMLKRAAKAGNFYATLALKQLRGLSTGAVHNSNVFIPNIRTAKAHTFQMFSVYLPGIKADVERRPNDTYVVTNLEVDASHEGVGRVADKPGIYECRIAGKSAEANYRKSKKIKPEENRHVIVGDGVHETPEQAALAAAEELEKIGGIQLSERKKFDMYFAPSDTLPEGMRKFHAHENTQASAHSSILAAAMEDARKITAVNWSSIGSGSAILSQSLMTINRRNLSFSQQQHMVRFISPKTDPRLSLNLARKSGFIVHPTKSIDGGSTRVRLAHMMSLSRRARDKGDPYTLKHYGADIATSVIAVNGVASVGLYAAGFVASAPALIVAGTVVGGVSAAGAVGSWISKLRGK